MLSVAKSDQFFEEFVEMTAEGNIAMFRRPSKMTGQGSGCFFQCVVESLVQCVFRSLVHHARLGRTTTSARSA